MSDQTGDVWATLKEESKQKRARNRQSSPYVLAQGNITFVVHNGGWHIVVDERIDFWPGTGLWIARPPSRVKGRGVKNLIRYIQSTQPKD